MWRIAVVFVGLLAVQLGAADDGFISLADGPELAQWRTMGAGTWDWQDGAIHCDGQGSGCLRSECVYEDFTLRFDCRIAPGGNSGVWLRAPARGRQSAVGMEFQIMGDVTATPDVGSTGALYDMLAPQVSAARPAMEWNEVEISCLGPRVRAVLNGQELYDVDLEDPALNATVPIGRRPSERLSRGFLGLTNHGSEVWYRNLRIREEPESGFESLFDGDSLEGWRTVGDGWSAAEGLLTGRGGADQRLVRGDEVENYVLRLEYRLSPGAAGAVRLRAAEDSTRQRMEVVLADDATREPGLSTSGALRGLGAPRVNAAFAAGEWNDLEIEHRDVWLAVRLNGVPVLDGSIYWLSGFYRPPMRGTLSLLASTGTLEFRHIRLRSLPRETHMPG